MEVDSGVQKTVEKATIKYEGTISRQNRTFIVFSNERGEMVQIPVESNVASMITLYLERLSCGSKIVERGNVEDSL